MDYPSKDLSGAARRIAAKAFPSGLILVRGQTAACFPFRNNGGTAIKLTGRQKMCSRRRPLQMYHGSMTLTAPCKVCHDMHAACRVLTSNNRGSSVWYLSATSQAAEQEAAKLKSPPLVAMNMAWLSCWDPFSASCCSFLCTARGPSATCMSEIEIGEKHTPDGRPEVAKYYRLSTLNSQSTRLIFISSESVRWIRYLCTSIGT
jgi:hypothetical protein